LILDDLEGYLQAVRWTILASAGLFVCVCQVTAPFAVFGNGKVSSVLLVDLDDEPNITAKILPPLIWAESK